MLNTLKQLSVVIGILLFSSLGSASHVSAMPLSDHNMTGMTYDTGSAPACATLCRSAVVSTEKDSQTVMQREDDETADPFYVQFQQTLYFSREQKSQSTGYPVKPPPKVPIYVMNGVFRN